MKDRVQYQLQLGAARAQHGVKPGIHAGKRRLRLRFHHPDREQQSASQGHGSRGNRGGKRVLPPGALDQCLCGTRRNPAFGMGFWLNAEGNSGRPVNVEDALVPKWWQVDWSGTCLCPEAPRDLFVSLGSEGQRLYVIPSLDMVVVRLSEDSHYSDAEFLKLLLR